MTPKPQAKANLLHQQVLGHLLDNKNTVRTEIRHKRDKKTRQWVEHRVDVAVPMLAGNVSEENVERAAKRWIA